MNQYKGIFKKKMTDGTTSIMVRFKHRGITYSLKNFTTLYNCKTEKNAYDKLIEVKNLLDEGKDPFYKSLDTFEELFMEKARVNIENETWKQSTYNSRMYYYKNHLQVPLGKKAIDKIKYKDVDDILKKFKSSQGALKNQLFDLLKPIFREEFNKGNITVNIMDSFLRKRYPVQRENLAKRAHTKHIDMVKQLYQAIPLFDMCLAKNREQYRVFFYLVVMTAHRSGELCQLTKEHCDLNKNMIIATPEITKTDETYIYPIPEECIDFIRRHKGGKLFTFNRSASAGRAFKKLVELADIEVVINQRVSLHDTRRLMMSVMIHHLKIDSRIADYCLEHSQKGVIKHYIEMNYDSKVDAFNKYWDCIRDKKVEEIPIKKEVKNTKTKSNIEELKELVDMFKNELITKEQFEIERDNLYV